MADVNNPDVSDLLNGLTDAQARTLLHLLDCEACTEECKAFLGERSDAEDALLGPRFERAFGNLEARVPVLIRLLQERRETGERLLTDLMACPTTKDREELAQDERFHHLGLVDLLLERSHGGQLTDPEDAASLARLAADLVARLKPGAVVDREIYESRALALAGNACRLAGLYAKAARNLEEASFTLRNPDHTYERGFLCRYLGIQRWEEERFPEGLALLDHAAIAFRFEGTPHEIGTCRALQGLLLLEERHSALALPYLRAALRQLETEAHPGLAARCCLASALDDIQAGKEQRAERKLKWSLEVAPHIQDPEEMLRTQWLEGRLRAHLHMPDWLDLLASVRLAFVECEYCHEATAIAGDIAVLLKAEGRHKEAAGILRELRSVYSEIEHPGHERLQQLAKENAQGKSLAAWEAELMQLLGDMAFTVGVRPQPFRFA